LKIFQNQLKNCWPNLKQNKHIEHLYTHWPFCNKKCWYCDFISFEKHKEFVDKYHNALCNEIEKFAKEKKALIGKIKTIFIGGGTPSIYPEKLFKKIFKILHKNFDLTKLIEVTIESNPSDINKEKLELWKSVGINRLSVGVQILDEKILQKVNRIQKNQSTYNALELAPKYFKNISVDLILGLPGTTRKKWFKTLEFVTSKPIKHVSVYFLTIYEKTPLYFKIKDGSLAVLPDDKMASIYEETIDFLKDKNFFQYEISNFSKTGYESIHNRAYWDRKYYRGFGLSAASFYGKKRLVNSNNLIKYIGSKRPAMEESLDREKVFLEELMLGLRQNKGVDLHDMIYSLVEGQQIKIKEKISNLKQRGLIEEKNGRVVLTVRGMILENEVVLNFIPESKA
jgi:oxygen-independent coproporphyrinogen-3 oxidase